MSAETARLHLHFLSLHDGRQRGVPGFGSGWSNCARASVYDTWAQGMGCVVHGGPANRSRSCDSRRRHADTVLAEGRAKTLEAEELELREQALRERAVQLRTSVQQEWDAGERSEARWAAEVRTPLEATLLRDSRDIAAHALAIHGAGAAHGIRRGKWRQVR